MTVDIYLKEKGGSREMRIPWLPETIEFETGETTTASYDIMNRGEVAVPTGTGLSRYKWESQFPGAKRTDKSMMRGEWKDPKTYDSTLKDWKESGKTLTLLVIGYPINKDVFVEDYTGQASGGFGDIVYSLSLMEDRNIEISSTKVESNSKSTERSAEKTTSYTIKKGDTLWAIAEKYLGSGTKWEIIYNANKDIIEQTAKKYKFSSSNKGWWIFPGCTITIPGVSSASTSSNTSSKSTTKKKTTLGGSGVNYGTLW